MKIVEIVKVTKTIESSSLYTVFVNAAQGSYVEIINGKDSEEIKRIESTFSEEFDIFAQKYFDAGRDYEKNRK